MARCVNTGDVHCFSITAKDTSIKVYIWLVVAGWRNEVRAKQHDAQCSLLHMLDDAKLLSCGSVFRRIGGRQTQS